MGKDKKQISYFIAYRMGDQYGNASIAIDEPITHMGYVQQVQDYLRKGFIESGMPEAEIGPIIVLNFQRFEEKEEKCLIER